MQGKYRLGELSLDGRKMCAKLYYIVYRLKYRVVCLQVALPALSVLLQAYVTTLAYAHTVVTSLISLILISWNLHQF